MKENIKKASIISQRNLRKHGDYGVEIVGSIAYTNYLGDTSVYHGKYRDNDFVGTAEECLKFIESKGITEVYGSLTVHASTLLTS